MSKQVIYPGRDLEAMSFAINYHRWILQVFKPYLGSNLVEVGAGSGSFSELLLEQSVQSLTLVEPSQAMFQLLVDRVRSIKTATRMYTYNSLFSDIAGQVKTTQQPDSIIYVNVLEHVDHDEEELDILRQTLTPNGHVLLFVPAFQFLYGTFDREVGHFRRYEKAELERKCRHAGFNIVLSRYFDLMGLIPWWIKFSLLKSSTLKPGAVNFYDRYIVPLTKATEKYIEPPFGKNLILVGKKI